MGRKWGLILIAFFVNDAFQAALYSIAMSMTVFMIIIRWKPFIGESSQLQARTAQTVLVVLEVRVFGLTLPAFLTRQPSLFRCVMRRC